MPATCFIGAGSYGNGVVESAATHATFLSIGNNWCAFVFVTESNTQTQWKDAGTFKNMYLSILTNARGTATTINFRNGAADGSESISVTANTTGTFSDLVDSDTISAGALINYKQLTGSGAGNFLCAQVTQQFTGSGGNSGHITNLNDWQIGQNLGNSQLEYTHPAGHLLGITSGENNGMATRVKACTLTRFYVSFGNNNMNQATTIKTRIALANGNNSLSMPANTFGIFRDTTDSDTITDNQLLDFQYDATASNSGQANLQVAGAWLEYTQTAPQNLTEGQTNASSAGAGTHYLPFMGDIGFTNTEANAQCPSPGNFSWINLRIITLTQPGATVTYTSRRNGANGNQSVSITSGAPIGAFEDTVDSDVISQGDLVNQALINGSSTIQFNVVTSQLGPLGAFTPPRLYHPPPAWRKSQNPGGGRIFPLPIKAGGNPKFPRHVIASSGANPIDVKRLLYMGVR